MPFLAYCITDASAFITTTRLGVNSAAIQSLELGGLQLFLSPNVDAVQPSGALMRDAALQFHRVLEEIFEQAAIIPFRFPTILQGEKDAIAHLREHQIEYCETLNRLRDMVQMEIRVRFQNPPEKAANPPSSNLKQPGTEYLERIRGSRATLHGLARDYQETCTQFSKSWKQRDSADEVRCFALISRASIPDFRIELQQVVVPADLAARCTGPWPATEFLKEER